MSLEQENIAQFIIGIYIFDISENKWEYIEDGFAKIVPNSYGTTLLITNKEDIKHEDNKYYFDKIISESFSYESKESDNKDGYVVVFKKGEEKVGVKFDKSSSQAFEQFKNDLNKEISKKVKIFYYDSGNLQYSGQFTEEEGVTGEGIEYYDTPEQRVKYQGEFEENFYDGAGTFYSYDKNIELRINNISKGKPNGNCTLSLHRKNKEDLKKTFNYKSLKCNIDIGDVKFCETIANHFYKDLDKIFFEAFTMEEKVDEINRKLELLLNVRSNEIIELEKANKGLLQKMVGLFWN